MEYGWVVLFVICLVVVYASLGLPSGGFLGKVAFISTMPLVFIISIIGAYAAYKGFMEKKQYILYDVDETSTSQASTFKQNPGLMDELKMKQLAMKYNLKPDNSSDW